jgi:asparagine synthetase B (glutamine-hydrolysing)
MLGFCGVYRREDEKIDSDALAESINVAKTAQTHHTASDDFQAATAHLENTVLQGPRHFENDAFSLQFAGDLVGVDSVPWDRLLQIAETKDFAAVADLRGYFALGIYDKREKKIHIVNDHRGQLPLFYSTRDDGFTYSTNMATFTVALRDPEFNIEWMFESLYFNYPFVETTFLKDVHSVRAASVVTFDIAGGTVDIQRYTEPFHEVEQRLEGRAAMDKCLDVFDRVIPKYYENSPSTIVPITYGLDCRMLLSYAPRDDSMKAYTYGVPGSADLTAIDFFHKNKVMLKHEAVHFDDRFEKKLPSLIHDTVRLSGGLQNVNRTSILYSYQQLLDREDAPRAVISGILGDTQFRGHANAPAVTSTGLEHYFETGRIAIDKDFYSGIFNEGYQDFDQHIRHVFAEFTERYGQPMNPVTHLRYIDYLLAPRYFSGELALVSNYATFRVPFWDPDIVQLAFETEFSTITFSQFLPKRAGVLRENFLQTNVLMRNPDFRRVPLRGLPLSVFASGNPTLYKTARLAYRLGPWLKKKISRKTYSPLEDWRKWYAETLRDEVDDLLGGECLLSQYVSRGFIDETVAGRQSHWLGKLVTTEILLRLIRDRWNIGR